MRENFFSNMGYSPDRQNKKPPKHKKLYASQKKDKDENQNPPQISLRKNPLKISPGSQNGP